MAFASASSWVAAGEPPSVAVDNQKLGELPELEMLAGADWDKQIVKYRSAQGLSTSPVLVGDKLYSFGRKGKGFVMAAGREYKILATNKLPHGVNATPVILAGKIYLRSPGDFYCRGKR